MARTTPVYRAGMVLALGAVLPVASASPGLFPGRQAPVGLMPSDVVAADLNGDGVRDLAAVGSTPEGLDAIAVALGLGGGLFAGPTLVEIDDRSGAIAAGDLDGDGDADLAVASDGGDEVVLLENDGSGVFSVTATVGIVDGPLDIALADLDGDGDLDLATANRFSDNVTVLRNDGAWVFSPVATPGDTGDDPYAVEIGDLDGDGDADVVIVNSYRVSGSRPATVSVLLNAGGVAPFPHFVEYPVGRKAIDAVLFDADGDGDLDIAAPSSGSDDTAVLFNDGAGGFGPAVLIPGVSGDAITAIDIGFDGAIDLVVAGRGEFPSPNTGRVLRNSGDGMFTPGVEFLVGDTGFGDGGLGAADLDGDAIPDLFAAVLPSGAVTIIRGGDDGTPSGSEAYPVGLYAYGLAIEDVDGDGDPDAALTGTPDFPSQTVVLANDGAGVFATALQSIEQECYARDGVLEDIDGDGDADILTSCGQNSVSVYENLGGGVFSTTPTAIPIGLAPGPMVFDDVNADGRRDLLTFRHGSDDISVALASGGGVFAPPAVFEALDRLTSIATGRLRLGAGPDLIVGDSLSGEIAVLPNLGEGGFGPPRVYAVGDGDVAIAAGDLDGDGFDDVAVVNEDSATLSVLINSTFGTLSTQSVHPAGDAPRDVAIADLDRDGDLDIVTAHYDSSNFGVYLNDGSGVFGPGETFHTGRGSQQVRIADVNGDAWPDVMTADHDGVLSVHLSTAYGRCIGADLATPFGVLDLADLVAFVTAFGSGDPSADFAEPSGVFDLADLVAFAVLFNAGCP